MAIVQVSRITNRKGLTENLPQLAGAELGWCVDSRRLFIGNGTLQEGAPVIGNTEILTEFSDVIALSDYTYKDSAVGYTVQTGETAGDPVVRTVQQKLDDFADVRDFGAVGNGVADDTAAINRALYQLYCRENNTQPRRTLYFPAGTYLVTESIKIPTWAKLVGEGADCTYIQLETSDISSLTAYVARTADSRQQVGANIGNNGAVRPRNIEVSSMTFQASVETDVFLVEDAFQCYFDSVNFIGPSTLTSIETDTTPPNVLPNTACVRFDSTSSLICNTITFDKCRFSGSTYGINTDEQIQSVTVSNGKFDTLYQGIVLGDGAPVNGGPSGFRAIGNMFDDVYGEGIIYDNVTLCASAYNTFYDVGNELQGAGNPATPVVLFGNDNNVSVSDFFTRDDNDANLFQRIQIIGGSGTTATQTQLGRYSRVIGRTFVMGDGETDQPIFVYSTNQSRGFSMDYTIENGTAYRHGRMRVIPANSDLGDSSLIWEDDFSQNSDTGVTLSASQTGGNITVAYSSASTGDSTGGTLTYSISHLA